jgi:hypothetical protein
LILEWQKGLKMIDKMYEFLIRSLGWEWTSRIRGIFNLMAGISFGMLLASILILAILSKVRRNTDLDSGVSVIYIADIRMYVCNPFTLIDYFEVFAIIIWWKLMGKKGTITFKNNKLLRRVLLIISVIVVVLVMIGFAIAMNSVYDDSLIK